MHRFAFFVDGSNLFGSLKAMNLEVDDYEGLFAYVYTEAVGVWREVTLQKGFCEAQLRRVYWYVVGSIDDWNLALPQSQTALHGGFSRDKEVKALWLAATGKANPELPPEKLEDKAWAACFKDFSEWYARKRTILDGMRRFHQGVRSSTDLIDIFDAGHWKVNFIRKYVEEKGLDTALAVDMVALQDNYDVGIIVSGDADSIPSIKHMKERNKHIAAVEFVNGSPPESKGRTFSSRLKEHADFVIRIYETELLRLGHARRPPIPIAIAVAVV
jgi:uncharacterized LabA/DUF88 family protein